VPGCPAVAPGGRGSTVPGCFPSWSSGRRGVLAGCQGVEPGDGGGDLSGPGPSAGDLQPDAAAAAGDPAGSGVEAQPQALWFPAAGRAVQGEHGHPGGQLAGQGDDLDPDLVLVVAVQGEVAQAGVFRAADPVLAPGAAAVP
jgi:hypothetical protein